MPITRRPASHADGAEPSGRQPRTLGIMGAVAYQLGLQIYLFVTAPDGWDDGLAAMSAVVGAPLALSYGALVYEIARRSFADASVPSTVFAFIRNYVLVLTLVVFLGFVGRGMQEPRDALIALALVIGASIVGTVFLPLSLVAYVGSSAVQKFLALAAIGVPSVGPIVFLIWRARRLQDVERRTRSVPANLANRFK